MWQSIGHKNQKFFLDNVIKNGRLSHAYLFAGPSQVGKRTVALEFANQILAVKDPAKMNPDFLFLDGREAKIEQMRELMASLSLRPYQYEKKVAVIDNFESVGDEAANSILKTLEEPNASSILILVTQNSNAVLPTIVSRCQVLNFCRLSADEMGSSRQLAGKVPVEFINGKIGKAINAGTDKKNLETLKMQQDLLEEIRTTPRLQRLAKIKALAEEDSAELNSMFQNWLDIEQYKMLFNSPEKYANVRILIESLHGVHQNLNKKLVLQNLFLNLI